MWGAEVVDVPVDAELRLDLGQMAQRAGGAGLDLHLQSEQPDGHRPRRRPTSRRSSTAALRTEPKATILIDEAYHEYVEHAGLQDGHSARPRQPARRRVAHVLEDLRDGGAAGRLRGGAAGDAGCDEPLPRRRPPELPERPRGADCAGRSGSRGRDAGRQPRRARDDGAGRSAMRATASRTPKPTS